MAICTSNFPNQICKRCVMDTSDPEIYFDEEGVCNHCHDFERIKRPNWFPNDEGQRRLSNIIRHVKEQGKGAEYDCILGLSGGVDSSYLALKVREWELRPLVVHIDAGWNSELAVSNIEAIVEYCNYDLHTHVVDWEEMKDLQLAYLRSGIANQDVPQDHIFFASLYHFAIENRIKYVLSGGNIATEGVFPRAWHGSAMDAINLKAIHRKFGTNPLNTYRTISFMEYYFWYPFVRGLRTLRPLNFIPYNKSEAVAELQDKVGYKTYRQKHGESLFTKLFQNYYLPLRFGYDKRRPHLSSLICSGQITRETALRALDEPLYDAEELENDICFFCKKLGITRQEFDGLMKVPVHQYTDFPNWDRRHRLLKKVQSIIAKLSRRDFNVYS